MLYTYCKESLSFKKVKAQRKHGIILGLLVLIGYIVLTSMMAGAKQEGFKEALDIPIESVTIILEEDSNQFSQDNLVKELKRLNVRFPHIVLAQSILETGYYESKIFNENHNLFGMKEARVRLNLAKGTQFGHAYYDDWKESLTDYALWYSTYANKCKNEKQLYKLLNKQYAEANHYPQALQRIIKRDQLKSKFNK